MASIIYPKTKDFSYLIVSDSYANDNTLDIWIKFTSYLKIDELSLMTRSTSTLSQSDLDKYNSIKKQLNMSKLFIKYKHKECNKEEHDLVLGYMHSSLKVFVRSRMTEEERHSAYSFISSLSKEEIIEYVDSQKDKYDELSAYKAYILFMANEVLYNIKQKEYNEKREQEELEMILRKELNNKGREV